MANSAESGNRWEERPGLAKDIGAGADGSVWIIGTDRVATDPVGSDFSIHRWNGSDWDDIDGGGVRIDVDGKGNPWVVNHRGQIFRRDNNQWVPLPGLAKDIGAGADGSVWIIGTIPVGTDPVHPDFSIHTWHGSDWDRIDGGGVQISVVNQRLAWMVNSKDKIFRRRGTPRIGASKHEDQLGGSIRVSGTFFTPNGDVDIAITNIPRISDRLFKAKADAKGDFRTESERFNCLSGTGEEANSRITISAVDKEANVMATFTSLTARGIYICPPIGQ
jgi:hypothetical protein